MNRCRKLTGRKRKPRTVRVDSGGRWRPKDAA